METNKKEIVICLGSSCFARGNKALVKIINDYLRDRNLLNDVKFHGERCFGNCASGPSIKFDTSVLENADEDSVFRMLDSFFIRLSKD